YLHLVARLQLGADLRGTIDPSDVVQETLLRAQQKQEQFRGATDADLGAWLRRILSNRLIDLLRSRGAADKGVSIERSGEDSGARLEAWLADESLSPSGKAQHQEELLQLADGLARLPPDQRTAVELKHMQGCSIEEIAKAMNRSKDAVGGLLRRGVKSLRD